MSHELDNTANHNDALEHAMALAMTRALEQTPEPVIPADFAARVAAKARTLPLPQPARRTCYGRTTAFVAALVLTLALFALAPHAVPSMGNLYFALEMLLVVQLCGLAYWLMRSQREL